MPSWRQCDFTPRIVAAIADGNAPANLTVTGLAKALPYSWAEQQKGSANCGDGRSANQSPVPFHHRSSTLAKFPANSLLPQKKFPARHSKIPCSVA